MTMRALAWLCPQRANERVEMPLNSDAERSPIPRAFLLRCCPTSLNFITAWTYEAAFVQIFADLEVLQHVFGAREGHSAV